MDIIQPLDLESGYRTFSFNNQHHLVLTLKQYFPLQGGDPIIFSDAYKKLADLSEPFIDEGLPKVIPEYFVAGEAKSPNGKPITSLKVSATIADKRKELQVIGDRYWIGGISGTTTPLPFTSMPLIWPNAFGGKKHKANPLGKGIDLGMTDLGENLVSMPNIEYPKQLMTGLGQQPAPAGFMPRLIDHPERSKYLGTYDDFWLTNRFPAYPDDFNLKAFNCAAKDQLITIPEGEPIRYQLSHFHSQFTEIEGHVPQYTPRIFLVKAGLDYSQISPQDLKEVSVKPDTIVFFPNQLIGMIIYRGTVMTNSADSTEFKHLLSAYESPHATARPVEHYHASLIGRIHPDLNMQYALTTKDLIPNDIPCGLARLSQQEVEPKQLLAENIEARLKESLGSTKEKVQQQLQKSVSELDPNSKDIKSLQETLATPKDGVWQQRFNAIFEKIAPGSTNQGGKIDLQKIDFRGFDELAKLNEEFANFQKQQVKQQLQKEAEQAASPQTKQQLQKALLQLDRPPLLPRVPPLESQLHGLKQSITNVEKQNLAAVASGRPFQPIPKYDEIEKKLKESHEASIESYRLSAHMADTGTPPLEEQQKEILKLVKERLSEGNDLSHMDLAGLNFSGEDLSGVNFSHSYLEQCNFTNCYLKNANFDYAVAARSNFTQADLSGASCLYANMGACNFTDANLCGAQTLGIEIAKSRFQKANLGGLDFSETLNLLEVSFNHANLENVSFSEATFLEIDFRYAKLISCALSSSTFNQCQLAHADLSKSILDGANFIETDLSFSKFCHSKMENARFVSNCNLSNAVFEAAVGNNSCFREAILKHAKFIDCQLKQTDFGGADVSFAIFDGSDMSYSLCMKTNFSNSDLDNTNFFESNLMQANLTSTSLKKSNFYGTEFMGATVGKTDFSGSNLTGTKLAKWRPAKWQ